MHANLELASLEAGNTMTTNTILPSSLPVLHEGEWEFQRALMQEFHRRHVQAMPETSVVLPKAS